MEYNIFSIQETINSCAIDISKIRCDFNNVCDSKEYLKSISKKIDISVKPIFDFFFEINNIPIERYPQYYCSPIWNECYNNYKWRYIIINDGVCNYLVFLRIVGIMYHDQYFTLSYDILSDEPQKSNIKNLIEIFKKNPCIKKAEVIVNGDDWDNINFYNTQTPQTTKYKNKKISLLYNIGVDAIKLKKIPNHFSNKLEKMYEVFKKERFDFDKKRQDKYMRLVEKTGYVFLFTYKNIPIGIKIVSNDFGKTIYIHASKDISGFKLETVSEYIKENDLNKCKLIKKFLGVLEEQYVNYCLFNDGYKCVYNDGFVGDKNLLSHKSEHYKNFIKYKLIDINDYECE